MRIEIEESALDSIKEMNQRLQEERDELLKGAQKMCAWHELQSTWDKGDNGYYEVKRVIARCNFSPKVME